MSITHRALEDDELTQATAEELYRTLGEGDTPKLISRPYAVDFNHDISTGGASSIDRKTVYIDRRLYEECMDGAFKATQLKPQQIIGRWCDHEHCEICVIEGDNSIDTYAPAHERALRMEHEGVLAILGRDDAAEKIKAYESAIWPALMRCYNRAPKKVPLDLWCGPVLDDPQPRDKQVAAALVQLGVEDASKQSKYATRYGHGAHRCGACANFGRLDPDGLAPCRKVSGLVRFDRGCELWQDAGKRKQEPERPQPGGPPVLGPDGHYYVHKPHAGGKYQRVVNGG
jgi:hypothetical protein